MLTISTKVRYATRLMSFLAKLPENSVASVREMAETENISPEYIEQILLQLKITNLVASRRGACGGFMLARAPKNITLEDIYTAIDGAVAIVPCVNDSCYNDESCAVTHVWRTANDALIKIFRRTTLASLQKSSSTTAFYSTSYDFQI